MVLPLGTRQESASRTTQLVKTRCTTILTREECTRQRKAYGSSCGKKAFQVFRVERASHDPVLIGRCKDHNKLVSAGINDKAISRLTPEEALIAEIHDS